MRYFRMAEEDNICPLSEWKEYEKQRKVIDNGIILLEMFKERRKDNKWCLATEQLIREYDCGLECDKYEPRNKKNGICKHLTWAFCEDVDNKAFILHKGKLRCIEELREKLENKRGCEL